MTEIEKLRDALLTIRAIARFEQDQPSGLHLTAFSIIEKTAKEAMNLKVEGK